MDDPDHLIRLLVIDLFDMLPDVLAPDIVGSQSGHVKLGEHCVDHALGILSNRVCPDSVSLKPDARKEGTCRILLDAEDLTCAKHNHVEINFSDLSREVRLLDCQVHP